MIRLDQLGQISNWITVPLIIILAVCLVVGIPLARRAGVRAASFAKATTPTGVDQFKDRIAMFAALAPSVLVWLSVMGVSFIGLTGFAADFMQWKHWTNMLVPLSLDGISISFGGWAFVAVKRGRSPGRSYRIVLAAASLSATLNFVHGRQVWSIWAGIYLAFLSLAGMAMFHEMLEQFMAHYDEEIALKARYPRFGQRWLWAPISTLKARRAWVVYPPREGTRPSVSNALEHWCDVRRLSREERKYGMPFLSAGRRLESDLIGQAKPSDREPTPSPGPDEVTNTKPDPTDFLNASKQKPQARTSSTDASEVRDDGRTTRNPFTNAEINAAAEALWIEHKRNGTELSGSQLLELFATQYPQSPRRLRWAAHRRKAAQTRFAVPDAAERTDEQSPNLDGVVPPQRQPSV